jgi:hypothetical protein
LKTTIQILIAAILLTATVQAGRAALKHYMFVDALQEALLFAGSRTEQEVADRVMEMAGAHEVPIDPDTLLVTREPYLIQIEAPYTETVHLLPGVYDYAWDFDASVSVRLLEDTRPRSRAPAPPARSRRR